MMNLRKMLLTLVLLAASSSAAWAQTYSFDGFIVGTNGKVNPASPGVYGDVTFDLAGGQDIFSESVYKDHGNKLIYSTGPLAFSSYASLTPGTETFFEFTPTFFAPFHGSSLTAFANIGANGQVTFDSFGPFAALDSFTAKGKTTGFIITDFSLVTPAPEPSTYLAMLVGMGFLAYAYRRRAARGSAPVSAALR